MGLRRPLPASQRLEQQRYVERFTTRDLLTESVGDHSASRRLDFGSSSSNICFSAASMSRGLTRA